MSIEDKFLESHDNDKEGAIRCSVLKKSKEWYEYDQQEAYSVRNSLKHDVQKSFFQANDVSKYKGDEMQINDERQSI